MYKETITKQLFYVLVGLFLGCVFIFLTMKLQECFIDNNDALHTVPKGGLKNQDGSYYV